MKEFISILIFAISGLFSFSSFANPDDSCNAEDIIFDAFSIEGDKHVSICYVYGEARYIFSTNSKPEIVLNVPLNAIKLRINNDGDQFVTILNGKYIYEAGERIHGGPFFSKIQIS
ncbi:hypothetical protein I2494_11810 [Budviciaceae bacterium BWR-B9]|uniref:Uncharacterized protein n=1 Tax=Limnobaculum allomyrinae TaxID=2791986 RepID=A0ABS1IRL4_9GAMM|nr:MULTISPECIES: hypothetical protein [Limnobaculum]MBK5144395.1 hypothetical protein [Limnobaculum allomyrinae]MBV7691860.1 hypothetical protein [Limnobaculum sp. M2-1]